MSALSDALSAARAVQQSAMEEAYGETVTVNGTDYAAAVSVLANQQEQDATTGLWRDKQEIIIRVRRSLLPACPDRKAKVVYNGLEFFIPEKGLQKTVDIVWKLTAKRFV